MRMFNIATVHSVALWNLLKLAKKIREILRDLFMKILKFFKNFSVIYLFVNCYGISFSTFSCGYFFFTSSAAIEYHITFHCYGYLLSKKQNINNMK